MYYKTALHYLFAGRKYYEDIRKRKDLRHFAKYSDKERKHLSRLKNFLNESWHGPYYKILFNVFCINLLARYFERNLKSENLCPEKKYDSFAPSTYFALKTFNKYKNYLSWNFDKNINIEWMVYHANEAVNKLLSSEQPLPDIRELYNSETPMGVELEFSNEGTNAGNFFEEGGPALRNFSKYDHYHLLKFMWRFGAYIDSNLRIKQLIKKGGFLEYTFTGKGGKPGTTRPLTPSPALAAGLINEAVKFTPVRPHSLHFSVEMNKNSGRNDITFEELIFFLMMTGDFGIKDGRLVETRFFDGDFKGIAVVRDRLNAEGIKMTIEYAHMRLSRDFVREGMYEPLVMFLLGSKNVWSFAPIAGWRNSLMDWALRPRAPKVDREKLYNALESGLLKEKTLPEHYIRYNINEMRKILDKRTAQIG